MKKKQKREHSTLFNDFSKSNTVTKSTDRPIQPNMQNTLQKDVSAAILFVIKGNANASAPAKRSSPLLIPRKLFADKTALFIVFIFT